LLSAIKAGQAELVQTKEKVVRKYDFRRPDKLSKEQLRTIQMLHENFARGASTELAGYLRSAMSISIVSVDQVTYQEYIRSLSDPTFMYLVPIIDVTSVIFEMSLDFVFAIIDKLLGGPGKPLREVRELTSVEATLMNRVMDVYLKHWLEAWKPIVQWNLGKPTLEYSPGFVQIMPGSDVVIVITYERSLVRKLPLVPYVCHIWLWRVLFKTLLLTVGWGKASQRLMIGKLLLMEVIEDITVEVSAVLGEASVGIGEILKWNVGDVIELSRRSDEEVDLLVEGNLFAKGIPGIYQRRKALLVTGRSEEDRKEEVG